MFFNRHREYAKKIGVAMLNHFRLPFLTKDPLIAFNMDSFHFPFGFWMDPYIVGQLLGYTSAVISTEAETKNLSTVKRGEVFMIGLQILCGENWENVANDIELYKSGSGVDNELFKQGMYHAALYWNTLIGTINPDLDDPILIEAKKLASKMRNVRIAIAGSNLSDYGEWAGAIYTLTLEKYIQEKYLNN